MVVGIWIFCGYTLLFDGENSVDLDFLRIYTSDICRKWDSRKYYTGFLAVHVYRMGIAEILHMFFGCACVQNEIRENNAYDFHEIMCRKLD